MSVLVIRVDDKDLGQFNDWLNRWDVLGPDAGLSPTETVSVTSFIDEHIPSLTDEDEEALDKVLLDFAINAADYADFAKRTCKCGVKVDGFYEYVDHLKAELRKAGFS